MYTSVSLVTEDKEFTKGRPYTYISRPDKYAEGLRKAVHYMKKVDELDLQNPADSFFYRQ